MQKFFVAGKKVPILFSKQEFKPANLHTKRRCAPKMFDRKSGPEKILTAKNISLAMPQTGTAS